MTLSQKPIALLLILEVSLLVTACKNNSSQPKIIPQNATSLFAKGDKLANQYFTGNAFLKPLLAKDANNEFALGSVTFEPGARTIWHTHPKGQVLIVTEGEGYYQQRGKPAQPLRKGDVVNIPANVEHWHGASATGTLIHIAITNYKGDQNVVWLQAVTDEEFHSAIKNNQKQ
jgi:quercetin dioxygenase-like cupin family protein